MLANSYVDNYEQAIVAVGELLSFALSDESVTDCVKPKDVQRVEASLKDVAAAVACLRANPGANVAPHGECYAVAASSSSHVTNCGCLVVPVIMCACKDLRFTCHLLHNAWKAALLAVGHGEGIAGIALCDDLHRFTTFLLGAYVPSHPRTTRAGAIVLTCVCVSSVAHGLGGRCFQPACNKLTRTVKHATAVGLARRTPQLPHRVQSVGHRACLHTTRAARWPPCTSTQTAGGCGQCQPTMCDERKARTPSVRTYRWLAVAAALQTASCTSSAGTGTAGVRACRACTRNVSGLTVVCAWVRRAGFAVLQDAEGPRNIMSTVLSHFEEAPDVLCYDNACNLSPYCLSRWVPCCVKRTAVFYAPHPRGVHRVAESTSFFETRGSWLTGASLSASQRVVLGAPLTGGLKT